MLIGLQLIVPQGESYPRGEAFSLGCGEGLVDVSSHFWVVPQTVFAQGAARLQQQGNSCSLCVLLQFP